MQRATRRIVFGLVGLGLAGTLAYMLWPAPVSVDVSRVARGSMRVTVDEDGRTRIKERYIVSAPLEGRMERSTLREGDEVTAGQTVLAVIEPVDPSLLDARARSEATARVRAAEARLSRTRADLLAANAFMELAQVEHARQLEAKAKGAGSSIDLERAAAWDVMRREQQRAAAFERDIAQYELELANAALLHSSPSDPSVTSQRLDIRAPISGKVLRVIQESAAVVVPGAGLVEIGDTTDLEIVVDVLSSDAVPVRPGAPVILEQWGGEKALNGRVRLVEPSAFTKISALGVEEQRVNVVIDILDPAEAREGLKDGFRVEARIVIWESNDAVMVPAGALFRHDQSWAVYAVQRERAVVKDITVGKRNAIHAEVVAGLSPGDEVVSYPSDRVRHGARVVARKH